MVRNVMLVLAYDGTRFHGWQHQPNLRTVQGCLDDALRRILRHRVTTRGAGRTDAGVHAAGQVANFLTNVTAPIRGVVRALGARLPHDITLIHAAEVPLTFHATHSAVAKLYRYRIYNHPDRPRDPRQVRSLYHVWHPLDIHAMQTAADCWVGPHDFTSFASKGNHRVSNVRTIRTLEIHRVGREVRIDVIGTGFLYNQVRNIVGTLVEIGRGHWPVERAAAILEARERQAAGPTAPANGLCMQWVQYNMTNLPEPSPEMLAWTPEAHRQTAGDRLPAAVSPPPA